jgi:uncharacterized Fe-S center protein
MAKVYFKNFKSEDPAKRSLQIKEFLAEFIEKENIELQEKIPLKVHFGEKGNKTYTRQDYYMGIIEFLRERNIEPSYIETNVLYPGKRSTTSDHLKIAEEHGFDALPIIIADGEIGDDFREVEINKKHFKKCRIAKGISEFKQLIVISHFKGHRLAGFGGAVKQLAMGCASKGGKMDQHATSKPIIIPFLCKKCGACVRYCPSGAINKGLFYSIDKNKCTGCAGCVSTCKRNAILPNFIGSLSSKKFNERLAEYAYAAQLGKNNIYINLAMTMTKGCDCEAWSMKPIIDDLGIFISTDPVAIDKACLEKIDERAGKKVYPKGRHTLKYLESLFKEEKV